MDIKTIKIHMPDIEEKIYRAWVDLCCTGKAQVILTKEEVNEIVSKIHDGVTKERERSNVKTATKRKV